MLYCSLCCKSTFWIIGTSIEGAILTVSLYEMSATLRADSGIDGRIYFSRCSSNVFDVLPIIYNLTDIILDENAYNLLNIIICQVRYLILIYYLQ